MNSDISKKNLKVLFIALILGLPFWWGVNVLADNLENFYFARLASGNSEIFTAQLNGTILRAEAEEQQKKIDNLQIGAKAAISVEVDKNGAERILYENNSQERLPMASITKLMTALVIFDLNETYNLDQPITISEEAISQAESSKYGDLKVGEKLSVDTLLHIMLIESSNDAAFALAELINKDAFVDLMNYYAKDMGLSDTKFFNPTGLDEREPGKESNFSTARDLVRLSEYILKNYPQIFEITALKSYEAMNFDETIHHFIPQNTNEFLTESASWQAEIIGGKTGLSPIANGCLLLVIADSKTGSYYINVILDSDDRFGEMGELVQVLL